MSHLSTHVLDTAAGRPAVGVAVTLDRFEGGARHRLAETLTNSDGRTDRPLLAGTAFTAGVYELTFHVGDYFRARGLALSEPPFLDEVPVRFGVSDPAQRYHVPLLLSPFGCSTYRGS